MRKSWWKRGLSLALAFCLTAGLSACGKGGGKNENAALAKENVYKLEQFDMPAIEGDDYNIFASTYRDGTVYMMLEVYHWSEESPGKGPGRDNDIRLLSMKTDGSDVQTISLEIPEWRTQMPSSGSTEDGIQLHTEDSAEEGEAGADGVSEPDGEAGADEAAEPGDGAGADEAAEPGDEAAEPEDGAVEPEDGDGADGEDSFVEEPAIGDEIMPEDVWENSSYSNYVLGADGKVYALRRYYYENYSTEEYIQKDYLTSWNTDGSFQWEKELEGLRTEEEYIYISTMTVAKDGSVVMILSGDNAYKMTVDAQGNVSERMPLADELTGIFNNFDRIIDRGDGTFYVIYYDENDWTKEFIATYDPATDVMGEAKPMPASFGYNGYNTMDAGISSDLVCSNNKGVYTFKIGDEDFVEKMSFVNSDLYINSFSSLIELEDSTFLGVFYDDSSEGMLAGKFTYVDPKDIPDKSVLVLAGTYINSDIKKRVIDFNRSSEEYRIVLKSYDSYNSYDDWQAGYTQLNNDITTGNMPDILITDGLPVENYISKGWLADIGSMIEKDEELSQTEFIQNILDAFSVDGKLYYIIPNFSVRTMIGKKSILGDRTSWTMEEMLQLKDSLPEGTEMMGELTRSGFFMTMMQFCGSDFVDVDTGKCDFDTPNFIAMMEYAKGLPEELDEDYYGEDYWMNYESQYREERTILNSLNISNIRDINYSVNGYFGEDVSYIGFPTENGKGSYAMANECYAISARSSFKDGAWEFMRYYLTDEYQSTIEWGLPIQKKFFDENAKKAMERPYYMDEDGNKVEYDDYFYMNNEEIKLEPLSQEQVDEVVAFVLSIDKGYYYNESVINIINEEIEAYFAGQKTAQEVAKIIQNRAQIYVNENR